MYENFICFNIIDYFTVNYHSDKEFGVLRFRITYLD